MKRFLVIHTVKFHNLSTGKHGTFEGAYCFQVRTRKGKFLECFTLKADITALRKIQNISKFRQSKLRNVPEDLNLHHYCFLDSASRRAKLLIQICALPSFDGATHACKSFLNPLQAVMDWKAEREPS